MLAANRQKKIRLNRVNLAPEEELENAFWFVPELTMAALVLVLGYAAVSFYFEQQRSHTAELQQKNSTIQAEVAKLEADVKRVDDAQKQLTDLREKMQELRPLTDLQVVRYMPVVVIEHLQNLKPDGLWFKELKFSAKSQPKESPKSQDSSKADSQAEQKNSSMPTGGLVTIKGFGFDNLIVAEFLTALRATQTQEVDASDIRTQVYFDGVTLKSTTLTKARAALGGFASSSSLNADEMLVEYELQLGYSLRGSETTTNEFKTIANLNMESLIHAL